MTKSSKTVSKNITSSIASYSDFDDDNNHILSKNSLSNSKSGNIFWLNLSVNIKLIIFILYKIRIFDIYIYIQG